MCACVQPHISHLPQCFTNKRSESQDYIVSLCLAWNRKSKCLSRPEVHPIFSSFRVKVSDWDLRFSFTVVFSRHLSRWWCWSSNIFSLTSSSRLMPASCAASLASAARFLATKAAPLVALAIWILASLAFWKQQSHQELAMGISSKFSFVKCDDDYVQTSDSGKSKGKND